MSSKTIDYDYISVGADRRWDPAVDEPPYNNYNIRIPPGWPPGSQPQGGMLTSSDTSFQRKYNLTEDPPADFVLTAQELVHHNPNQGESWHYSDFPPTPFVAQTTIAASYGLLQISWMTAVYPMGWVRSPSQLIGVDVNLRVGTDYLRRLYDDRENPELDVRRRWRTALVWYNLGKRDRFGRLYTPEDSDYDDRVLAKEAWCMPQ